MTDNARTTTVKGRLEHVATVVSNLDEALSFYSALLGLRHTRTVRLTDHTIGYLSDGRDVDIELICFDAGGPPSTREPTMLGLRHTAWSVPDLDAAVRLVPELGGTVTSAPTPVEELGFYSALVLDPMGTEIELVEWFTPQHSAAAPR